MEIIMENYIWFAVAGVILLMAFIGYIAEKTDFGRKEFEKKVRPIKEPRQKKKKEETPEVVEVIEDAPVEEIIPTEEEIASATEMPEVIEDLSVPLVDDSWGEPILANNAEELTMEEPKVEEMTFEEIQPEETIVEETPIIETEVSPVVETVTEEPTEITVDQPKIELENLELPAIDSLNEEESEDDVWKF